MPRKKYLTIEEKLEFVDETLFEGPVELVINGLRRWQEVYNNYNELILKPNMVSYQGCQGFELFGKRLETNKERNKRLQKEKRAREQKQQIIETRKQKLIKEIKKLGIKAEDLNV